MNRLTIPSVLMLRGHELAPLQQEDIMTFLKKVALAVALPLLAALPATASTVDIIGDTTAVTVTADLAGLGLDPGTTGTATAAGSVFSFGITGGSLEVDTGSALIEHDGSGVSLTAGSTTATVGDFLIDTEAGTVSGTLNSTVFDVVFFNLGAVTSDGIQLLISDTLGSALTSVFGAPDLAGEEFGLANLSLEVAPVPLPAGMPLLAVGVLAFGALRRRKRAMQV